MEGSTTLNKKPPQGWTTTPHNQTSPTTPTLPTSCWKAASPIKTCVITVSSRMSSGTTPRNNMTSFTSTTLPLPRSPTKHTDASHLHRPVPLPPPLKSSTSTQATLALWAISQTFYNKAAFSLALSTFPTIQDSSRRVCALPNNTNMTTANTPESSTIHGTWQRTSIP